MPSIFMLVSKAIWDERNARVFRGRSAPTFTTLQAIKHEATLWVLAGVKHLGPLMQSNGLYFLFGLWPVPENLVKPPYLMNGANLLPPF